MEISIEFIKIEEEERVMGLSAGIYLCITKDGGQAIYVPYETFKNKYDGAKNSGFTPPVSPGVDLSQNLEKHIPTSANRPDFLVLMNFLAKELKIEGELDDNSELIIDSSSATLLELPWEKIVDKTIFVIRRVEAKNPYGNSKESMNNFLYLLSHSFDGQNSAPIKINLDNEIENIFLLVPNLLKNETVSRFRLSSILLSVHTTKDMLSKIRWKEYQYIHVIAHGDDSGEISLESDREHEKVDKMNYSDFLKLISYSVFELLFFSFCFSAGGCKNGENLAFSAVNDGIAKYAIGYSYGIGGDSASKFAQCFYNCLLSMGTDGIESIYKNALSAYRRAGFGKDYIPLLFSAV